MTGNIKVKFTINPNNFQNLANISELFDRIQAIDTQDIKFRIKIKKLQFAQYTNNLKTLTKNIKCIIDDIENIYATEKREIMSTHHELLEKVCFASFWYKVDFTTSHMIMNLFAPLMKYKLKKRETRVNFIDNFDDTF